MANPLAAVRGKVFRDPVGNKEFGPIRVSESRQEPPQLDPTLTVLAEDVGGNLFGTRQDGSVWFWDHETDDLQTLADSIPEFVIHCGPASEVTLKPGQVKSVWIDPKFAKAHGLKAPPDGWVKRKSGWIQRLVSRIFQRRSG